MPGLIIPLEWNSEGVKTNPAGQTVLAQFQVAPDVEGPQTHRLHWVVSATVGGAVVMEHIEDDGATVLRSHVFPISAGLPFESMSLFVTLDAGQRFRVRTGPAIIVGNIQASLFVEF